MKNSTKIILIVLSLIIIITNIRVYSNLSNEYKQIKSNENYPYHYEENSEVEYSENMILLLIFMFSTGFIGLVLAKEKNRNLYLWFFLCFIFNILGILIISFKKQH